MAMKHYIVPRARQADHNNMIKIHAWCSEVFGTEDYANTLRRIGTEDYVRWSINFARDTEDYVEFGFRDDTDASAFVFQWGEYCVSKEKQYMLGLCSWDEV